MLCDPDFEVTVNDRNKKIISLAVVLVIAGGLASLAARSKDQETGVPGSEPKQEVSLLGDSEMAEPSNLALGNGELFFKMMLSVVLVGVLGVAALYISRRVLPRVTHASGKEIRILETAYLGPRKAIHLVEVSHQKLLIGSTNDSIAMLTHIEEGWLGGAEPQTNDAVSL